MTYPVGVLTRQVNIAALHDLTGNAIGGQVQVESAISLKWAATGELFLNKPETIFLDTSNGTGSITLPIIQQGFLGPDGAVLAKWTYTFTPILDPNSPVVEPYIMELGYGDGNPLVLDFDDPTPSIPGVLLYRPGAAGQNGTPGVAGPPPVLQAGTPTTLPYNQPFAFAVRDLGNGQYALDLAVPGGAPGANGSAAGVPTGGTVNQVLTKNSSADFDSRWADNAAQGIPAAGTAAQVLAKIDGTDYNTHWVPIPLQVPNGGATGQVLTKNSNSDQDFGWAALPAQHDLPTGGVTAQVLVKNSGTDRDVKWADPATGSGVPNGGTAGQVLAKRSAANGDAGWTDPVFTVNSLPAGTLMVVRRNTDGSWPARPTARTDIFVAWDGDDRGPTGEPIVITSGTGGKMDNVDYRWIRKAG